MLLVVGLGNPGERYTSTRHNVGFRVVDRLAAEHRLPAFERRGRAAASAGSLGGSPVTLVKPLTYMNRSGEALAEFVQAGEGGDTLLVVVDDIYLPLGALRLRGRGGAGGHNGLESVIECLGHQAFPRVRVGIGSPPPGIELADYVLDDFDEDERAVAEETEALAACAVSVAAQRGLNEAMNRFNRAGNEPNRPAAEDSGPDDGVAGD